MRLTNRTQFSDAALIGMVRAAARSIGGLRTTDVAVRFRRSVYKVRGTAGRDSLTVYFYPPSGGANFSARSYAANVFGLIAHELKHVKDKRAGRPFSHAKRWANRPQERRANRAQRKAVALFFADDPLTRMRWRFMAEAERLAGKSR